MNVRWPDEVPRRPQRVGAKNASLVDLPLDTFPNELPALPNGRRGRAVHALRERPFRRLEFLRLHGAEPADDVCGTAERRPGERLIGEASQHDRLKGA